MPTASSSFFMMIMAISLSGCSMNRQSSSQSLKELARFGASSIPSEDGLIVFNDSHLDDGRLREALPHLKAYGPTSLNFNGRNITDASVQSLLELRTVSDLNLAGTQFTTTGLCRLKEMKSLRTLSVDPTHLDEGAIQTLRTALPNVKVNPVRTMN